MRHGCDLGEYTDGYMQFLSTKTKLQNAAALLRQTSNLVQGGCCHRSYLNFGNRFGRQSDLSKTKLAICGEPSFFME